MRTSSWSSTISSRIVYASPPTGSRAATRYPPPTPAPRLELSSEQGDPFPHPDDPRAPASRSPLSAVSCRRRPPRSSRPESRKASVTVHAGGPSVLEHVRKCLLDDAIDRQLHTAWQRLLLAFHLQPYRQPGVAVVRDQLVQIRERRLRARLGAVPRAPSTERVCAAARPGSARRSSRRGRGPSSATAGDVRSTSRAPAHADQHHGDRAGDDVVELAGDRRSFLVDRDAGQLVTLALELGQALLVVRARSAAASGRTHRAPRSPALSRSDDERAAPAQRSAGSPTSAVASRQHHQDHGRQRKGGNRLAQLTHARRSCRARSRTLAALASSGSPASG